MPTYSCSLLKEAHVVEEKVAPPVEVNDSKHNRHPHDDVAQTTDKSSDERQLLSRYGIWLLVELCRPTEHSPIVSFVTYTLANRLLRHNIHRDQLSALIHE